MNDYLREPERHTSNWLDVIVFAIAFLLGIAAYLSIRALLGRNGQLPITVTLVVLMTAYVLIVVWVPRLRVRKDQAGDNSYYLGLLFTLASMAFALYDFKAEIQSAANATGVQQIISNFGIALATTIVGIFLRVILHQMRVDPADLEATTRIELTEAAERLRATLDSVTTGLGRFHQEMQQRSIDVSAELLNTVRKTAVEMNAQVTEAARRVATAVGDAHQDIVTKTSEVTRDLAGLATEAAAAAQRLRAVEPPPLALSKRLDKVAEVLERVAAQSERTTAALRETSEVTERGSQTTARTSELLEDLAIRIREEHTYIAEQLTTAANGMTEAIRPFSSNLQTVMGHLSELEARVIQSTKESISAQKAAGDVLTNLTFLTKGITHFLRNASQEPHART
jgi:cell division septum initiation protein DivIVA